MNPYVLFAVALVLAIGLFLTAIYGIALIIRGTLLPEKRPKTILKGIGVMILFGILVYVLLTLFTKYLV